MTDPQAPPRLIDVSHTVEHGMVTYKGLPAPLICDYLSREASRAALRAGHRVPDRQDRDGGEHRHLRRQPVPPLRRRQGPRGAAARVARQPRLPRRCAFRKAPERAIDRLACSSAEVRGRAVLVHTGWDRHWRTDQYFEGHPYLTGELAEWLVAAGAALVGIDSFNIDSTDTGRAPGALDRCSATTSRSSSTCAVWRRARARRPLLRRAGQGDGASAPFRCGRSPSRSSQSMLQHPLPRQSLDGAIFPNDPSLPVPARHRRYHCRRP